MLPLRGDRGCFQKGAKSKGKGDKRLDKDKMKTSYIAVRDDPEDDSVS